MEKFNQQGDVLMFHGAKIPKEAKKLRTTHLAEGEATGHYHDAQGKGVALLEHDGRKFLHAPHGCTVTHQEHKEQVLPAGDYEIRQVVEFDPFEEEIRTVRD